MTNQTLPIGIVTFLFTDIQGSTPRWESQPEKMAAALKIHNAVLGKAIQENGGTIFKTVGDAIQAAFPTATQAVKAAVDIQRGLLTADWNEIEPIRVRIGLHTGEAELDPAGDEYAVSHTKNRVARIMSAGHGGQILISNTVVELLSNLASLEVTLQDLGAHHLKGMVHPEHIYQVNAHGLPNQFPALKTSAGHSNLPVQLTPFFGRENELERIGTLLADPDCRLITLVGIGGTGKSRLAIEATRRNTNFEGDIFFVGLASIQSFDDLIVKVAESIQYTFYNRGGTNLPIEEAKSQLLRYLADKKMLLVIDNFEQLSQYAEFLTEILTATSLVKLLVTSRERLNLPGEWVLELSGLSWPDAQVKDASNYAAVQLFIQTATRSGNFDPTANDYLVIAQICRLLEGMPLGIEMAAAMVRYLSYQEILAEIEQNLDFLTATWRIVPDRHHTMRAVFESSWRLLSDDERSAITRLAILQGGFQREAANRIAGTSIAMLSTLVNKSFLRRIASGRYEIHPVLRPYAVEKLFNSPEAQTEARTQHAHYYSEWLDNKFEQLKGEEQFAALTELRSEIQDLRAAFQTLMEQQDFLRLERIYPAFILFFEMNNQSVETKETLALLGEMEKRLRQKLNSPELTLRSELDDFYRGLLAITLSAQRHFTENFSEPSPDPRLQESLELLDSTPDNLTKAYALLLDCRGPELESDKKLDLCQHSYGIFKTQGDVWGAALAQLIWADEMNFSGFDATLARIAYQASKDGFMKTGSQWGHALCLSGLMTLEYHGGKLDEAYQLGMESMERFRSLGNYERVARLHHSLAELALARNLSKDARLHYEANLAFFKEIGDKERYQYYRERLGQLET